MIVCVLCQCFNSILLPREILWISLFFLSFKLYDKGIVINNAFKNVNLLGLSRALLSYNILHSLVVFLNFYGKGIELKIYFYYLNL